jgi:hypothetical protein
MGSKVCCGATDKSDKMEISDNPILESYVGETVTLWCLTDFLQNSKYSKETLELNRRDAKKRKRDASRDRKEGE